MNDELRYKFFTHLMINGVGERVFDTIKSVRSSLMPENIASEHQHEMTGNDICETNHTIAL